MQPTMIIDEDKESSLLQLYSGNKQKVLTYMHSFKFPSMSYDWPKFFFLLKDEQRWIAVGA